MIRTAHPRLQDLTNGALEFDDDSDIVQVYPTPPSRPTTAPTRRTRHDAQDPDLNHTNTHTQQPKTSPPASQVQQPSRPLTQANLPTRKRSTTEKIRRFLADIRANSAPGTQDQPDPARPLTYPSPGEISITFDATSRRVHQRTQQRAHQLGYTPIQPRPATYRSARLNLETHSPRPRSIHPTNTPNPDLFLQTNQHHAHGTRARTRPSRPPRHSSSKHARNTGKYNPCAPS